MYYWWAKIFGRSFFCKFNQTLYYLSLRGLGVLNDRNHRISGEKFLVERILPRFVKGNSLLLDVGANEGNYAILLKNHHPHAAIWAFEPHPLTFARLQKKTRSSDIEAHNIALGSATGTAKIYDHARDGSQHASLYRETQLLFYHSAPLEHEVQVRTLDEIFADRENCHIAFLKIDTEGSELECLRGAKNLIERGIIDVIQFEFNEMNVVSRVFLKDFFDILPNYQLHRLLPQGLSPLQYNTYHEIFKFQNIVAILKR